ncbi:MAG TPA: peptidase, partial [Nitrosarchaeum sp.]|nr:peptidase [Nitrosarchaeum sp.]
NSQFNNHFSGSMVVEVIIRDPNLHDTDQGKGEPDVTINGKSLRMVQSTDGNWYAYFANVNKAKIADSTQSATSGKGLDFGVFCSRDTSSSVFGISLSDTDGFTVPGNNGLSGFTNGATSFTQCTGTPTTPTILNNVVRHAPSINTNSNIPSGQIGLDRNAWPLIQLFSFNNDVKIQYNAGGNPQSVVLQYDDSANISSNLDKNTYPQNSEVFLTVNDFQLNQDPTDEDSWTFNINSTSSTFYQAYDNSGSNSANGNAGLANLIPYLSNLGFKDNGKLSITLGNILKLKSNDKQPTTSVNDGSGNQFSKIVTLVENGPNSGIFDSSDDSDKSTISILNNAPRGQTGQIEYNKKSMSVLTESSTASISITQPALTVGSGQKPLNPGTKYPVVLFDPNQNINSGSREHLDVFRDTSIVPTLKIGNPITLGNAYDVQFYPSSPSLSGGDTSNSSVPDKNSARLFIDTSNVAIPTFKQISMNLGISASNLQSVILDSSLSNTNGTNWLNYDLRSFEKDFGITDFTTTSMTLSFSTLGSSPVTIVHSGDLSSSYGFVQLSDSDIQQISSKSGTVYLVINFGSAVGTISAEQNKQPIVFDLFSFGLKNNNDVNNAIYRFELEETNDNSSTFTGSLEYATANQLNILDPNFIKTLRSTDNEIKFIITNKLTNEKGIAISYSDLDAVGVVTTISTKSDIFTNSGVVYTGSTSYRFGQPVTITLKDPDLNLRSDTVDIYLVNNDPNSSNVDTVGSSGDILLEVLIKDIRYKRCTINGIEYGGLASTGFTLVETGPSTGVFEGTFKMPSQICDKSGTKLISSAGGSLDAKYHDSRDASGNPNIFSLLAYKSSTQFSTSPQLSKNMILIPSSGNSEEVILSGSISNAKNGVPLSIVLMRPDGVTQNFSAVLSNSGSYRTAFSINEKSVVGVYKIQLFYNGVNVGSVSFTASPNIPDWIKNNTKRWSSISDSEFVDMLNNLTRDKVIMSPKTSTTNDKVVPSWVKNIPIWWSNHQISDDDFIKSIQYMVKKGII